MLNKIFISWFIILTFNMSAMENGIDNNFQKAILKERSKVKILNGRLEGEKKKNEKLEEQIKVIQAQKDVKEWELNLKSDICEGAAKDLQILNRELEQEKNSNNSMNSQIQILSDRVSRLRKSIAFTSLTSISLAIALAYKYLLNINITRTEKEE